MLTNEILTVYQIGDVVLDLHEVQVSALSERVNITPKKLLFSSETVLPLALPEGSRDIRITGRYFDNDLFSADGFIQRLKSMLGRELDVIAFVPINLMPSANLGNNFSEQGLVITGDHLLWLHCRGMISGIDPSDSELGLGVHIEISVTTKSAWEPLNRLFWEYRSHPYAMNQTFSYSTNELLDSLIAAYDFAGSDGTDSHDSQNLTKTGTITSGIGRPGLSAVFASGAKLSLADNAAFSVESGQDITIAFWAKLPSLAADIWLVSKWVSGGTTNEYIVYYSNATNLVYFQVSDVGNVITSQYNISLAPPTVGEWAFFAARYKWPDFEAGIPGEMYLRINTAEVSGIWNSGIYDGNADIRINETGTASLEISSLRFWGRALTDEEIDAIYNGGAGLSYGDMALANSIDPEEFISTYPGMRDIEHYNHHGMLWVRRNLYTGNYDAIYHPDLWEYVVEDLLPFYPLFGCTGMLTDGMSEYIDTDDSFYSASPFSLYRLVLYEQWLGFQQSMLLSIYKEDDAYSEQLQVTSLDIDELNTLMISQGYNGVQDEDILYFGHTHVRPGFIVRNGNVLTGVFPPIRYAGDAAGELGPGHNRIILSNGLSPASGYDYDDLVILGSASAGTNFTHAADCRIVFRITTMPTAGNYIQIVFRQVDTNNEWYVRIANGGAIDLFRRISGTPTSVASSTGIAATNRILIIANRESIYVYANATLKISYTTATDFKFATTGQVELLGGGSVISQMTVGSLISSPTYVISGTVPVSEFFYHEADCSIVFILYTRPSSGGIEIRFRRSDGSNYWAITLNSAGNFSLFEVVGGGYTLRGFAAAVLSSGQLIRITCNDETIAGYYNGIQAFSYSSAVNFKTKEWGQVSALGTGGVVSNLKTYPYPINEKKQFELQYMHLFRRR